MMFDGQVEVNEQARINKELTSRKKPTTRSCSHGENEDVGIGEMMQDQHLIHVWHALDPGTFQVFDHDSGRQMLRID